MRACLGIILSWIGSDGFRGFGRRAVSFAFMGTYSMM